MTDSSSPETNPNTPDRPDDDAAATPAESAPAESEPAASDAPSNAAPEATPESDGSSADALAASDAESTAPSGDGAAEARSEVTADAATAPAPAAKSSAKGADAGAGESLPTIASDVTRRALARDFSIPREAVDHLIEALETGLQPPYIGRFDRAASHLAQEGLVRRFAQRLAELDELDRRRGTVVRTLEGAEGVSKAALELARSTVDRHVLEDLYLPYRQPEPEVQLAFDRGLGQLADALTAAAPPRTQPADEKPADEKPAEEPSASEEPAPCEPAAADPAPSESSEPASDSEATSAPAPDAAPASDEAARAETSSADASTPDAPTPNDSTPDASTPDAPTSDASTPDAPTPDASTPDDSTPDAPTTDAPTGDARPPKKGKKGKKKGATSRVDPVPAVEPALEVGPELARACAAFVSTDRAVNSERDALEGAMRILSDRLGRDPHLRSLLRKQMRRHAVVTTRAGTNEERMKRHKGLLKLETPVNQLQGSRLLGLRQAQRERALHVGFQVSAEHVLPKIKAALCSSSDPLFDAVLDVVAWRAWTRRLRPVLEEDLRMDLKSRADDEATRLLIGQIRQLLLAPTLGPRPAAGIDFDARGDMTVAAVDPQGSPLAAEVRIQVEGKDDLDLAEALAEALRPTDAAWVALAAGRGSKAAIARVRRAVASVGGDAVVTVVSDVGLSAWANGESARRELPDVSVSGRMALGLARRLQDPMAEMLKVDPRHWGIGTGTSLLTKAAARRVVKDAIQSCVCTVGVDMGRASIEQLVHLPGVDRAKAKKLVELRDAGQLGSRKDVRASGLFDEVALRNVVAFMRFRGSDEPFDRSSMHPEQYDQAMGLIEATGRPFEDVYTRNGGLKGLKRSDFGIDEATWRDLQREVTYPGRDPRPRLFPPKMLPPGTAAESLEKGQYVEGIVTTVTNFGAFVDIGADKEGLVHVSRVSQRFVRDAREAVSVGQVVRAVVVDPSAQRIGLSIKDAPSHERGPRGQRPERAEGSGGGRGPRKERAARGRGAGQEAWPEPQRMARVAHSRRDGIPGRDGAERRGGGGRGKSGAGAPGGGGRGQGRGRGQGGGARRDGEGRREDVAALTKGGGKSGYSPFAKFFKGGDSDDESDSKKRS